MEEVLPLVDIRTRNVKEAVALITEKRLQIESEYPTLVELPPMLTKDEQDARLQGPNEVSNWLIPDRVLVGASPWTSKTVNYFVDQCDLTAIVCLQEAQEFKGRSSYLAESSTLKTKDGKNLSIIHFPIRDRSVADDNDVAELTLLLERMVLRGHRLFIHCWGGHGRTGTVASLLLMAMYKISPNEALDYTQRAHDTRSVTTTARFEAVKAESGLLGFVNTKRKK